MGMREIDGLKTILIKPFVEIDAALDAVVPSQSQMLDGKDGASRMADQLDAGCRQVGLDALSHERMKGRTGLHVVPEKVVAAWPLEAFVRETVVVPGGDIRLRKPELGRPGVDHVKATKQVGHPHIQTGKRAA
jgi:hypothetical protein